MPVPRHREIRIGTPVSIVLKADQRTGRQVQGTVAQLLTRGDHPRGVKVRLADGRIGRVQQLAQVPTQGPIVGYRPLSNMNPNDQNPWSTSTSQGNPYVNQQTAQQSYGQCGQQQQQQRSGEAASFYTQSPNHHQQQTHNNQNRQPPAPAQHLQRADTDTLLAQQGDRAEQLEHMQNYEASAPQTADDKNQAQLQKEFPNVDSSLIAALYGDTKDLSATREMLQELARN